MKEKQGVSPSDIRKEFVRDTALPLMRMYGKAALGSGHFFGTVDEAREDCWEMTKQLILKADDSVNVAWSDKDSREKIEQVLMSVSRGILSPRDGKKLISLISIGIESVELLELAESIEELKNSS